MDGVGQWYATMVCDNGMRQWFAAVVFVSAGNLRESGRFHGQRAR